MGFLKSRQYSSYLPVLRRCLATTLLALICDISRAHAQGALAATSRADSSRATTEIWLTTELAKIHVRYAAPLPFVGQSNGRDRFGSPPQSPTPAFPRGERITHVSVTRCTLELERRFGGGDGRPDPATAIARMTFDPADTADVWVEPFPHPGFGGTAEALLVVRARRELLETVWISANGGRTVLRPETVRLPMPTSAFAEDVALHIRRLAALCQEGL